MGFHHGCWAEYLLWCGWVDLRIAYMKPRCSLGLQDFSVSTGTWYLLNWVVTFHLGWRVSCGVIELSGMFGGRLGEQGTLAGDVWDELGTLVVL